MVRGRLSPRAVAVAVERRAVPRRSAQARLKGDSSAPGAWSRSVSVLNPALRSVGYSGSMKTKNFDRSDGPGSVRERVSLGLCLAIWWFAGLGCVSGLAADVGGPPTKAAYLFQSTKVWTVHLQ